MGDLCQALHHDLFICHRRTEGSFTHPQKYEMKCSSKRLNLIYETTRDGVADLKRTRECGGEQCGSREGAWKTSSFVGFGLILCSNSGYEKVQLRVNFS